MAISTNGGSNPTSITYNGKNVTEFWYKSSPSATAVKVWPDLPPYKHIYIAQPNRSGSSAYEYGNYEKNEYGQQVETNWKIIAGGQANPWGNSFVYHNIAYPDSYIEELEWKVGATTPVTLVSYKVPNNIKGLAISGPAANAHLNVIEDGYIIPLNSSTPGEKVAIPENRKIEKSSGVSGAVYYFNDEVVSIPSPTTKGGSVSYTIEIPQTAKYVIKLTGINRKSASYWYKVNGEWYYGNTLYYPECYYTDDYWEEKYNKEV